MSKSEDRQAFYCRDCEVTFDGIPDGTGYDQTVCPRCGRSCLTVEFEREEQRRHRGEAGFFQAIGVLTELFTVDNRDQAEVPDDSLPATLRTFMDRAEAEEVAEALIEAGIAATLRVRPEGSAAWVGGSGPLLVVDLLVPPMELKQAEQLFQNRQSLVPETPTPSNALDSDIEFHCEDCGTEIRVSGSRRGKIEICPRCRAYVDVPE